MALHHDETSVREALADAYRSALAGARSDSVPDPDAGVRQDLATLAQVAPAAGTAAGLLSAAAAAPVGIDPDTLDPTSEPLTTLQAVHEHFISRRHDGVGLLAGPMPTGSTLFAVVGRPLVLRDWMRAVATETHEQTTDDGRVIRATIAYRAGPQPIAVRWSAPTVRARSYVAQGAALRTIDAELRRGAQDAKDAQDAYLVWAAPPHADGRRLVVRTRRLADGVTVLGNGEPVPWHVARSSGWTLTATGAPIPVETTTTPGWLTEAIRATWKKETER